MNITNFSTSNVDTISVYNELKYLESKLHKARKPEIWYNRINSLYNKWYDFTKKYGALLMIGREIKLSNITQQSQIVKDIQKIMIRVEQYYTTLTLNLNI